MLNRTDAKVVLDENRENILRQADDQRIYANTQYIRLVMYVWVYLCICTLVQVYLRLYRWIYVGTGVTTYEKVSKNVQAYLCMYVFGFRRITHKPLRQ